MTKLLEIRENMLACMNSSRGLDHTALIIDVHKTDLLHAIAEISKERALTEEEIEMLENI